MTDSLEDSDEAGHSGKRGRFRAATPPAKAPSAPATPSSRSSHASGPDTDTDHSRLDMSPAERAATDPKLTKAGGSGGSGGDSGEDDGLGAASADSSDTDVVSATGSMAIATLLSRITGFLRTVFIASALGGGVASAFNTANTLPNLITELVLGAVLTSLVVPLLVRAEKEDPDRGAAFIRRLLTLTFTLMMTVTVVAVFAAPLLTRMSLDSNGDVNIGMSSAFAYLVLPQIVFYAMFAVMMAVLNTKGVFKPGAWAPVVNNVVTLAIMGFYILLPDNTKLEPNDNVTITDPHIMLLGLGTTVGVVAQAAIMVPYLRKAGIDLRPLWGLDDRLKQFGGMAVAIVVYVLISQAGWVLNNRIASGATDAAPTIYMQHWQLLQVPYGVIGVTLLTAVMPRLSRNAADGDDKAVVKDLSMAARLTMLALVPVIVFFTAFGSIIAPALFAWGEFSLENTEILGWTISFSAFTLIPYAVVLLHLRVFYAREEVWTPTFIIGGITVTKVALAYMAPVIASQDRFIVVLLGAANGMGFVAGAIIGHRLLKRSLGHLGMRSVLKVSLWALGASVFASLVVWRLDALVDRFLIPDGFRLAYVVRLLVAGVFFLAIVFLVMSRSKLPEVTTIGATLARLPVVGRLFSRAAAEEAEARPTARITELPLAGMTGATGVEVAGTVMPPLSAGRVRGPRLVPGAPILHGRFRLLADHGGSPAARLWQARDNESGDLVALTVIDPQAAGASSRELLDRTATLAKVSSPGVARIREICNARALVVVVSDWTEGAPLTRVAESRPDPLAAGYAMADISDAAGDVEDLGGALGIDHRNRLRISSEGRAVLAFPGVLPGSSPRQDIHAIAVSLDMLLAEVPPETVPVDLQQIVADARRAEDVDMHALASRLRAVTTNTSPDAELVTSADVAPNPEQRAGFGAAPQKASRTALSATLTVGGLFVVVAVIVVAVAYFTGNRPDSPVTPNSIRGGETTTSAPEATPEPTPLSVGSAEEWAPDSAGQGTLDRPEDAPLIIDGDTETLWSSAQYVAQIGDGPTALKPGIGLLLSLDETASVTSVDLEGVPEGTSLQMRTGSGDITEVDQTELLDDGTSTGDTMTLGAEGAPAGDRVLLWITALPMPDAASVAEVTVHGVQE